MNLQACRNISDRVAWLLENHEDTRDNIKLFIRLYWEYFDGIFSFDGKESRISFAYWFENTATSPETLRRTWQAVLAANPNLQGPLYAKRHHRGEAIRTTIKGVELVKPDLFSKPRLMMEV